MRSTQEKHFAHKALTLCLLTVFLTTSSMVALAGSSVPVGELNLFDRTSHKSSAVLVNGQAAVSGRTIFSSETITTPEEIGADLNLGKAGQVRLDPGTSFSVISENGQISGELASGKVTVLSAPQPIVIRTVSGNSVSLSAGESTGSARDDDQRDASGKCIDTDNDGELECDFAGIPAWGWYTIAGVAAAIVVIAVVASRDDDDNAIVSPVR